MAEIQVFRVTQKTAVLDPDLLRAIDKAIPFPLLFELAYAGRIKLTAAWKRPSKADRTRWVVGDYFEAEWLPEEAYRSPLPVVRNLGVLYERLLSSLVEAQTARLLPGADAGVAEAPLGYASPEVQTEPLSLEARIAQAEAIETKAREFERIKARLAREKQFNRRVAINAELRAAKKSISAVDCGRARCRCDERLRADSWTN
ncbi:MAG: DUF4391 domain-containing protein [Lamprobacter sp.]|uniref:DUF4391 domain-containing protein n=1 Tax=Lamprobacter sp. TaxID=3100796 RepID=UPI002B257BC4|nr:DUF4391 domain-containing protein [Lamprobacter sp.]MEA3640005.1 DUF4391 domain-containing protein [Lamprobacter sp.]